MVRNSLLLTFALIFLHFNPIYAEKNRSRFDESLDRIRSLQRAEPNEALNQIEDLLELADLSNNQKGILFFNKAELQNKKLNIYDQSIISYYKSLRYFESSNDVLNQSRALNRLGRLYKDLFNYDLAIQYYNEIYELPLQDTLIFSYVRYNSAIVLRLNKQYEESIKTLENVLESYNKVGYDKNGIIEKAIECHLELGLNYIDMKKWDEAINSYMLVADMLTNYEGSLDGYHGKIWNSLGYIYLKKGVLDKARKYLEAATPLKIKENDTKLVVRHYNNLGLLELAEGNKLKAISLFKKGLALDFEQTSKVEVEQAYNELIRIYEENGDIEVAYGYSKQLIALLRPFNKLAEQLEVLHKKYLGNTTEYEIKTYELQEELKDKQRITIAITWMSIGILLTLFGLFIKFKRRQKLDDKTIKKLKSRYREYFFHFEREKF